MVLASSIDKSPYTYFAPGGEIDEANWLYSTYYYDLFFVRHDWTNRDWQRLPAFDQPPVAKYIFGAALHLFHHKLVESPAGIDYWFSSTLSAYQIQPMERLERRTQLPRPSELYRYLVSLFSASRSGEAPTQLVEDDYRLGRKMVVAFSLFSTLLLVAAARAVTRNAFAALLAGVLFLNNGVTVPALRIVFCDSFCSFFSLAALLSLTALLVQLRKPGASRRPALMWSALVGASVGLGLATKFINMYAALAVALAFTLTRGARAARLRSLAVVFIVGAVLFVAVNPYLWEDPAGKLASMFHHRFLTMESQARVQMPAFPSTFGGKARVVFRKGVMLQHRFGWTALALWLGCFLAGLRRMALGARDELGGGGAFTATLAWIGSAFLLNGWLINIDWNRYYIPFAMATSLLVAVGIDDAFNALKERAAAFGNLPS